MLRIFEDELLNSKNFVMTLEPFPGRESRGRNTDTLKGFCPAPHVGIEQHLILDQFSSGQRPSKEKMIFRRFFVSPLIRRSETGGFFDGFRVF